MKTTENYLRLIGIIIFSNKTLIACTIVAVTALAVLASLYFPPTYLIQGSLVVKSKKIETPPESLKEGLATSRVVLPASSEDTLLELKIITSYDLIRLSVEELYKQGAFVGEPPTALQVFVGKYIVPPYNELKRLLGVVELPPVDVLALDVQEHLDAEVFPGANVVDISLYYGDAVLGAKILNTMFNNYLRFRLNIFTSPAATQFYGEQLERDKKELAQLEKEYYAFLKEWNIADAEEEISVCVDLIHTLSKELVTIENGILDKENSVKYTEQILAEYLKDSENVFKPFPYDFQDVEIHKYTEQFNNLLFEYLDALKVYDKEFKKVQLMEEAIRTSWSSMMYLIRGKIRSERNLLATLKESASKNRLEQKKLTDRQQKLMEAKTTAKGLVADMDLRKESYENFFRKLEESRIEQMSQLSQMANAQILSSAAVPQVPFFPNPLLVVPVGILSGFLLAFALGFLREYFGHTFKTPAQVQEYLSLPLIGSITYKKHWRENRAYKALRGRLRRKPATSPKAS